MNAPPKNHIEALTGIRFVAAFGVFIQHMLGKLGMTRFYCPFGDGGVTFFFVLSGFILTYVYADRLTRYRDVPRFYFTRWARIWPLHVVTLAVYIFCFFKLAHIYNHALPTRKLIVNVLLLQSWIPSYSWCFFYNGVSWSISTEAFFYFMFPLLIIKRGGFWLKYIIATVAIAAYVMTIFIFSDAINQTGWASVIPLMHCFPVVRLFEFMTGMAVARLFLARPRLMTDQRSIWKDTLIELGVIGLLVAYYVCRLYFPNTSQWPVMLRTLLSKVGPVFFFATIIFFFSHTRGVIGRFMGCRLMVYLGEISFAFYMIHFFFIRLLEGYDFQPLPMYYGGLFGATLVLSIASASLLYHVVELPSKACLLALYDRGIFAMAGQAFNRIKITFQSAVFWASVATVATTTLVLQNWTLDRFENKQAAKIIENTELFDRPVHFGNEAILFGLVSRKHDQNIEIELAWVKKRSTGRPRFVEIYSSDNQPRNNIRPGIGTYANAPAGKLFLEKISIASEKFTASDRLSMRFFSQKEKSAIVITGPRDHKNPQLYIYTHAGTD